MHPEPEPPQRDSLVGHSQRELNSAAADLLWIYGYIDVRALSNKYWVMNDSFTRCGKLSYHEVSDSEVEFINQQQREVDHLSAILRASKAESSI